MKLKKVLGCVLSLGLLLSPISVHAEVEQDAGYVAYAIEGNRVFTSIEEAWNMAKQGRYEVYLNKDWNIDWRLIMYSGDNATLNLNGHSITRQLSDAIDDGEVIYMNENSSLTLNGGENRTFKVSNYEYGSKVGYIGVETGGVITGGMSTNGAGGIHMKANCTLTLNHVGVVGNYADGQYFSHGGAIQMDGNKCTLNMNEGSMISYNTGYYGGGVLIDGEDGVVNMSASEISNNYSSEDGGGIYSLEDATYITLDKGSKISDNRAKKGGGIYFKRSYAHINSNDSTGKISSNFVSGDSSHTTPYGGGICFGAAIFSDDIATVKNITLENNTASQEYDSKGGAIYTDLANIEIENCTFKNNKAKQGGAIYILEDGISFKDCTITNNSASDQGGAIFVNSVYDISISGKMVVKDNTKGDGNTSNIYLENGTFTRAYVSGTPDSGSEVGLTGDGDCKVGIKQSSDNGSFFVDNPSSYHLQYDDGKLYQKKGATTSSIFGNGNIGIACVVVVGVVLIGFVVYKKKKVE